jgi:ABC-type sugar transport system ATPase subunit
MNATSQLPEVILEARAIVKSFPGVRALDSVDLVIRRGELNALLGANGAGKSTLMNILAGLYPPDAGQILIAGIPVNFHYPRQAQNAGITSIFQELSLVPCLSVAENIFLGREPLTKTKCVDYALMYRQAAELFASLHLQVDPRTPVGRLRVGQQQVVEIARALARRSRILILDEPTSAITWQEIETLFCLINSLKQDGTGIVYITHKLEELPKIADTVTVLREGRLVATGPRSAYDPDDLVRLMAGCDRSERSAKPEVPAGKEVLRAEHITLPHPERPGQRLVDDVSFCVRSGEVLGIFGLMGSGRTELLEAIFGLHPRTASGVVTIEGRTVVLNSPRDAIAAGIGLAPEDRKMQGLVLDMSVEANISLVSQTEANPLWCRNYGEEAALTDRFINQLQIKTPSARHAVRNLSGGNQQKVVLAKWLATKPKVLLLDEPTRGIDLNAKREIYGLINELAASGMAIILVSSEMSEIQAISDRILVISEGRVRAEFARSDTTEENLLRAALSNS